MFKTIKARAAVGFVVVWSAGLLVAAMSPASAAAHSDNVTSCQHGGWNTLLRADDTAFKNQGACVAYAARGGGFQRLCYDATNAVADFTLTGPIDTLDNATRYRSTDGSCTSAELILTGVSAPDVTAANAKCQAIAGVDVFQTSVRDIGFPTVPSDWWVCLRFISIPT